MFESLIRKKFVDLLLHVEYGSITVNFPEGNSRTFKGKSDGYKADITLKDWRVIVNLVSKGDIGFAKDYSNGYWDTTNLEALLNFGIANEEIFDYYGNGGLFFKKLIRLSYLTKRNTLKGSEKNIKAHYDLGNNFYELWLDPSMTYSAAIFSNSNGNLEQAQKNKYARILDKIDKPKANILEVGCGWGGFAEEATKFDHHVRGITLSESQASYAKNRLLHKNVHIAIEDYRIQKDQYDFIVSIEMFEAVGMKYWPIYFSKLKDLLRPGGKILLQTITIRDDLFNDYHKNVDMIRTYIFPGGMLPSEKEIYKHLTKLGMVCNEVYRFGMDYALTLQHWLKAFDDNYHKIKDLGFNDKFIPYISEMLLCRVTFKVYNFLRNGVFICGVH